MMGIHLHLTYCRGVTSRTRLYSLLEATQALVSVIKTSDHSTLNMLQSGFFQLRLDNAATRGHHGIR